MTCCCLFLPRNNKSPAKSSYLYSEPSAGKYRKPPQSKALFKFLAQTEYTGIRCKFRWNNIDKNLFLRIFLSGQEYPISQIPQQLKDKHIRNMMQWPKVHSIRISQVQYELASRGWLCQLIVPLYLSNEHVYVGSWQPPHTFPYFWRGWKQRYRGNARFVYMSLFTISAQTLVNSLIYIVPRSRARNMYYIKSNFFLRVMVWGVLRCWRALNVSN